MSDARVALALYPHLDILAFLSTSGELCCDLTHSVDGMGMPQLISIKTASTNKRNGKIVTSSYNPSVTSHKRYGDRPFPIQSSQDGREDSLQAPTKIWVPDPLITDHKNLTPLGITLPTLEDVLPTVLILDYVYGRHSAGPARSSQLSATPTGSPR